MGKKMGETIFAVWQILVLGVAYDAGLAGLVVVALAFGGLGAAPGGAHAPWWRGLLLPVSIVLAPLWGFLVGWWSDRPTWWGGWAGLAAGVAALAAPDLFEFLMGRLASLMLHSFPAKGVFVPDLTRGDVLSVWRQAFADARGSGGVLALVAGGLGVGALFAAPPTLGGIFAARRRLRKVREAREAQEAGQG